MWCEGTVHIQEQGERADEQHTHCCAPIAIIELLFKAVDKRANWGYNHSDNGKCASRGQATSLGKGRESYATDTYQ